MSVHGDQVFVYIILMIRLKFYSIYSYCKVALLTHSTRNIRKITNNSVQKYQLKHFLNTLLCFSIPLKSKTSLAFTNEHSTAISSQLHDLPTFQVHYEIWFSLFECLLFRLLIGCTTKSCCMRHVILYWAFIDIA